PRLPGRLRPRPLALEPLEGRNLPSFIGPVVYDTGRGPQGLAVGDLRGNGRFDIVTANAYRSGTWPPGRSTPCAAIRIGSSALRSPPTGSGLPRPAWTGP